MQGLNIAGNILVSDISKEVVETALENIKNKKVVVLPDRVWQIEGYIVHEAKQHSFYDKSYYPDHNKKPLNLMVWMSRERNTKNK